MQSIFRLSIARALAIGVVLAFLLALASSQAIALDDPTFPPHPGGGTGGGGGSSGGGGGGGW
jgi:hypothetical protein